MGRMGTEPIPSVKWSVFIHTMLKSDGDGDGHGMCKQTFTYSHMDVFVSDSRDVLMMRLFGSHGTSQTNAHEVRLSIKLPKHDMSVVISCC